MFFKIVLFFCVCNSIALAVEKTNKGNNSYLLPDNAILPENYKITIDVTKSFIEIEKREFFGEVEITAKINKEKLNKIILHSVNNEIIGDIRVNNEISKFEFDTEREFLIITPTISLEKGSEILINIKYKGKLNDDMSGFYVIQYSENGKTKYVLTTQFQATEARKAFPCFDEPKYKATFELKFKKEPHYLVLSNSYNPSFGRGQYTVRFSITPKMSTYLVAFIISEFQYKESPYDRKFKVWSRPNALHQTKWAADYVFNITESLNTFTGIQYSDYILKMDMVVLPNPSGGDMENWGILTYWETTLLLNDELSTNRDIQYGIAMIAHEVSHQWFGNLVTCHWWKNTWLNEGFATYFEYHTIDNVLPKWEMRDQFVTEILQIVFGYDSFAKTSPVSLDAYTPSEINDRFNHMTYSKAGSIIRMMEHFLGSNVFRKGLQRYLHINRLSYTEPKHLFSAIQDVIDELNVPLEYSLNAIMTNWISQPGYPVINVTSVAPGNFMLSQQRFYINPNEAVESEQSWFVPISYTTSKELNFSILQPSLWLHPNVTSKVIVTDADTEYMIVNVQEAGYYRVNYDARLWQRIAEALAGSQGGRVHRLNKAQLVDDVLNLARAGLVDYSTAFNVTDFLATETGYYPWYSAFASFRYLLQRYADNDDTGMEIKRYLRGLMALLIKNKEFVEITESHVETLNRVQALEWACKLGNEKCITQAKELFQEYKKNGKSIPRNLRSIVFCIALRNGNEEDWNFLWNEYLHTNITVIKVEIRNALGCSVNKEILKRYLQKSIDPDSGIRIHDIPIVLSAVFTGNSIGVEVAFDFFSENYNLLKRWVDWSITLEFAARMTDKTRIAQFLELIPKNYSDTKFRDTAIETMNNNIAWTDKYGETIGNILREKRTKASTNRIAINQNNRFSLDSWAHFIFGFLSRIMTM